jgi:hypothetical protein
VQTSQNAENPTPLLPDCLGHFCAFAATIRKIALHETADRQAHDKSKRRAKQKARDFRPGLLSQKFCGDQ